MNDPRLLQMSSFLVDYPFADRLYPDALGVIEHLRGWRPTVILSDGSAMCSVTIFPPCSGEPGQSMENRR
jgi:hypothetical protein